MNPNGCFSLLLLLIAFVAIIGGGAVLWYLSDTAEFAKTETASQPANP
jgi:uncharacterized membrane protein (DUF4010 family)